MGSIPRFPGKRVLVLSDSDTLARVLALSLEGRFSVEVLRRAVGPALTNRNGTTLGDLHLIVVALSSPSNEPVVELHRASLIEHVGQVPLLIISDKPFRTAASDMIRHLQFPFEIETLHERVRELLAGTQVAVQEVS
jgi:hypothetical protein